MPQIPNHLIQAYRFQHDRIQQSAYSMIPDSEKPKVHHKIGKLYLNQAPKSAKTERIFEGVNQLNLAVNCLSNPEEATALAQLNLQAAKKANATSAFTSSLNYLKTGITLLPENSWQKDYDLTLALYCESSEAALLCVDFQYMEKLADIVLTNARTLMDKITIQDILIQAHYARNNLSKVIDEGLIILKSLGHRFPKKPTTAHVLLKLARTQLALTGKPIMELNELPEMTDPNSLATMRVGFNMAHAAYGARPKLNALLGLHGVLQTIKYGIAPESPAGFAGYGMALCGMVNDIDTGLKFGKLAMVLNKRNCANKYRARTILIVSAFIDHWEKHLSKTLMSLKNADSTGQEVGDFEYATLSSYFYCAHLFFTGAPLKPLSREIASCSKTIKEYKQDTHFHFNEMTRQAVLNFIEETDDPCQLSGDAYDEEIMLPMHHQNNDTSAIHMLFFYKLMLGYHFENYPEAYKSSGTLKQYLEGMVSSAYIPLYHFYDSLLRLATYTDMSGKEQKRNLKIIAGHQKKMKKWAGHAPMNYLHKWTIVEAERLKVVGEDIKAAQHYDEAILLAGKQEYIQDEALANELAAKFWLARKNRKFAELYMQKAVDCYKFWNANAKVDFLHKNYPQLIMPAAQIPAQPSSFVKPALSSHSAEAIDLNSIIKASQAISGEIVLDQLLKKLITVVMENAGAQKALILSENNNQWTIEAEGTVVTDGISALTEFTVAAPSNTPLSIIRHVAQIKKNIVLQNAAQNAAFKKDPYIIKYQPRSVLCSPIFHQGKMTNILYLENSLISGAFTPDRLELIQFLSSQAAISLQNASLYFQLQASEKKYRSLFENAIEGIFQLSTNGRFISVNQSMASMLGYNSPKQLMASDENMKYHFFPDHNAREQFAQAFREKGHVIGYKIEGIRRDNIKIWGSLSIRAIYDSNGQISYYEGSVIDITHQKNKEKAEKEAEAAKAVAKAKNDFLTNMSHEIRTPMNAIIGMTELALETELSTKQYGYLENIKIASNSLVHLIDDILQFSKIEAGKIEIEHIEFKLSDIINKIAQLFSNELPKSNIKLVRSISNDIPQLLIGDPFKISRILINLISNAVKFTDTGEILLRIEPVSRDKKSVQLRFFVKDTGIGIAKEHISKLFESFIQADGSITRKYGGTGLGLTISKSLVELMGGRIWAESIEGQGSTFYFKIQCQYKTDSSETKKPLPSDLKGMKVLLVEDNPINRQIAVETMENRTLTVDVAENGEQAIKSVKKNTYDAVLMDIHMPVMDGFTATRIIREDIRNRDLPIIAMTAHTINYNREKCLQAGMDEFIPKPFKPAQLIAALSKYFLPDGKPVNTDDEKNTNDVVQDILSSGFPEKLPGINIKSGLLRLEGKRDLYIRVLSEFYNNYRDIAKKIENGIESHNAECVQRTAHTLKSLAGNLGAETLQQTSRIIETKASDDLVSIDKQIIEQLKNNLDQVFLSIRKILDEHC